MASGYINDFYKQFEELNNKLDKLLKENKEQSLTIYNLNLTIEKLNKTIEEKDKKIETLLDEIDRLKNKNDKNSTNSSKPSSTNITTPKKRTGANQYNYRIKSNKKVGGQFGHKGHNLNKKDVEDLINNRNVKVIEISHVINGNSNKEPVVKYRLGIETITFVEKHIFKYSKKSNDKLPKEFYTDVTYDSSIKAMAIDLGTYNVISYERLSDYFNVISNGVLNIANSTLVNFLYEFSNKSLPTIKALENNVLDEKCAYTDETTAKFNGKNMFVRNYSNNDNVVYKAHKNKGHKSIIEDNILTRFCGGIMGDHDTTLQKYGNKNYECNIHLGRYLEELIQNVKEVSWAKGFKDFFFRVNNTRKIAKSYGLNKFDKSKLKEYENEFDNLIKLAKEQNKQIKSSYYKDKAEKLYRRLKKYKKNHLYFIKDFDVPFDNNLSEQDLRIFKIKTKVSGGFRSMIAAEHFVNALSIIKTSIKRKINPFKSIKEIFENKILFAQ